jgi:glycosyltransferase involved in cell wall biosynthesis
LVATDVPGCREIVRPGENGYLVPPGDAGALAAAIERLVEDPAARETMGAHSRRVAEEFSEPRVIADTLRVYAHALEGRGLPPLTAALER